VLNFKQRVGVSLGKYRDRHDCMEWGAAQDSGWPPSSHTCASTPTEIQARTLKWEDAKIPKLHYRIEYPMAKGANQEDSGHRARAECDQQAESHFGTNTLPWF
jgi:hypothetical protein